MPGEYAYSIAGQLSWVNLIFEVVNESLILPLYFFMGQVVNDKQMFTNRIKTGAIIIVLAYGCLSLGTIIFIEPLLQFMAVDSSIILESAQYIRLECIANIFGILYSFFEIVLVTIGKEKLMYEITIAKLVISVILDSFLISTLPVSFNLGVNGIAVSNIISNIILSIVAIIMLAKSGHNICKASSLSFKWVKQFAKVGQLSGLESLIRNLAYIFMVSKMVNIVGEQGIYWVANNFIWGWMLLPILQLGKLIKQETAKQSSSSKINTLGYFAATAIICSLWIVLIPLYKPFIQYILGYSNVNKLFNLVMLLFIPYIFFAFQNVFDSTFYGRGKVEYMLWETVVTNTIYYGVCFILYKLVIFEPSLTGIAIMFGLGNIFDAVVSGIAYKIYIKKTFLVV